MSFTFPRLLSNNTRDSFGSPLLSAIHLSLFSLLLYLCMFSVFHSELLLIITLVHYYDL